MASLHAQTQQIIQINDPLKVNQPKDPVDMNLSDQDRHTSQNYVHEQLSYRQMREECEKLDDPNACRGRGKTEFLGIDSTIVEMVGKAFTAVVGSMGAGQPQQAAPAAEGATEGAGQQGGGQQLPCQYIAIGTEAAGTMMQQLGQQEISSMMQEGDTNQKKALYGAANSHEQRAQTAQFQGVGYGATAGCFAVNTVKSPTGGNILKAAASGFLSAFYLTESQRQQEYANQVKEIAEGLPGKGDCNPITEKECYCAQPETQNDPDHCMSYLHDKKIAQESYRVPCIDGNLGPDMKCTCVGEQNCFDKKYFTDIDLPGFSDFISNGFGSEFAAAANGELRNGSLSTTAAANAAKANRMLREISKLAEQEDNSPLTLEQRQQSQAAEKLGIPGPVARLLARQPVTPAVKANIAKLRKGGLGKGFKKFNYARTKRNRGNVLRFGGGKGFNKKKRRAHNSFQKPMKKGKRSPASGKAMSFAMAKAAEEAEINKKSDTVIFEIISRRYQVSAWRRLDLE